MNGLYTILLLVLSNIFMTLAWYGHLKLQQTGVSSNWPLYRCHRLQLGVAFFEYCCRYQPTASVFVDNGGPFNLVQLKVIQNAYRLSSSPSSPISSFGDRDCTGIISQPSAARCSRLFRIHEITDKELTQYNSLSGYLLVLHLPYTSL